MSLPTNKITLAPLGADPLNFACPQCGTIRLSVDQSGSSVPGGGYCFTDGDSNGLLYNKLLAAGKEQPVSAELPARYQDRVLVGDCPHCHAEYFGIETSMIAPGVAVDTAWREQYLHGGAGKLVATLRASAPGEADWLVERFETPLGILESQFFGLFVRAGQTLRGPFGVASCGTGSRATWQFAANYLLERWDAITATATAANRV